MDNNNKPRRINPWGITGGLFGSVLAVGILVLSYKIDGMDNVDVMIVSAVVLANGFLHSKTMQLENDGNELLDDSLPLLKSQNCAIVEGGKIIETLVKKTEVQQELIVSLREKADLQHEYIEVLKKQVSKWTTKKSSTIQ